MYMIYRIDEKDFIIQIKAKALVFPKPFKTFIKKGE